MCNIVPSLYVRPTCLRFYAHQNDVPMCPIRAFGFCWACAWPAVACYNVPLFVLKIAAWIFYKAHYLLLARHKMYKFVFYNRLVDHRKCEMKPKKKSPCKEAESTKCAKKSKKENSSFYLIFKY
jgi:hypothetical protein